jgi:hypothetical protein
MAGRAGRKWSSPKITVEVLRKAADAGQSAPELAAAHGFKVTSVRNACARHKIALRGMGAQAAKNRGRKGGPHAIVMPDAADLPPIDDANVDPAGCRGLWQSVLLEQVRLALTVGAYGGDGGFGYSNPHDQARARDWFGTRDFHMVCALAGLEGDVVLQGFQRQLVLAKEQEALRDAARAAGQGFRPWGPAYREKRSA